MHEVVTESLEEYLSGALGPAALRDIEAHLASCPKCRQDLRSIEDVSQLFGALRSEEVWDPVPGFSARVMERVVRRPAVPTFASLLTLDLAFGRRLVFASLLVLAVLGGYLVSHEAEYPAGSSPEAILAQQNAPAFETARAEDNMLVTLTAYEH